MGKQLGIVFTGGEGPEPEAIRHILENLPAQPLIAAADSGLLLAESAGIKPDWVVGDMDSLKDENRLRFYPDRVIRHAVDKDHTDTELALTLLWEKDCDNVWIIGGGGGRIDHLFGIRDLFERERFPRRWITATEDIHCIYSGANDSLALTLAAGSIVSVFPLGGGPWKAESRGLKWPLNNVHWERGLYGLSNIALTGKIEIYAVKGRFIIILEKMEEIWQR